MRREVRVWSSLGLVAILAAPLFGQLPAGWTSQDVGNPAAAGQAQYDPVTETWIIRGGGTGIRSTSDQFQYTYKTLSGDGELVARVVSLDPPLADWAMAGVMIRVMLTPGSPYIFQGVSANTAGLQHGVTFWGRQTFDAPADQVSSGATGAPHWVKVQRAGDTFSAHSSSDGKTWTQQYSTTVPGIPKNVYIGYVVTSEVGSQRVTAVFDRGPVKAWSPDPADGAKYVETPLVRWTAGVNAIAHDVFFGTSATLGPDDYRGRQSLDNTSYRHGPGLTPGTTYYWRIDEVASDHKTIFPGDVWSFSSVPATAYAPRPWDGLDGVAVDADLVWVSGYMTVYHKIYFGTDKAAVEAGDPSVFKGDQLVPSFDPGPLAENTTYYWRIDEQDVTWTVHAGPVWSFKTVGPGLGVQAEYFAGAELAGTPILTVQENAIDHNWGSNEVAGGLKDNVSARWTADLEAPFTETVQFITTSDDGVRLWLNGKLLLDNWTSHSSADDIASVNLVAGQFYRLKMEWFENGGNAVAQLAWQSPSIARQIIPAGVLQWPVHAVDPYPAHASSNVPQTPLLRWVAGPSATQHDVYFGADAKAVAEADPTTAGIYQGRQEVEVATFDPGPLEWNTTYYWRVDEVEPGQAGGTWTGSVWRFTTADFLVVDDFESYTDEEGRRIYEAWLDDYAAGVCGSTVGYMNAPFAEQKIVHSGAQSMPLDYNNVCTPHYSQIEREFSPAQNWTVNDVNTLVLHVRGRAGNVGAPLFVAIQDSTGKLATVRHPDSAIVQTPTWTAWKVPLSEFTAGGVNLTRVKKVFLSVGSSAQPAPGSSGVIFIDDLWVVKP
ncbi:MAG TPA: PA14 domain-containing protein [Sedimentisphaerales bacterium]|nr:PA14 domain-containing protein [Sedimentisphaerales bacterium]